MVLGPELVGNIRSAFLAFHDPAMAHSVELSTMMKQTD
jgi:hypothetical protein